MDEKELLSRITINTEICHGKPVIRGMRYPVENIIELMASGMTIAELMNDYPDLEEKDFYACLLFAAHYMKSKEIYKVAS